MTQYMLVARAGGPAGMPLWSEHQKIVPEVRSDTKPPTAVMTGGTSSLAASGNHPDDALSRSAAELRVSGQAWRAATLGSAQK